MSQPDLRRPVHDPNTASRVFSGEAVIILPALNSVRMLNTVGSRIWELADGRRSIDEIVEILVAEYEVTPDVARAGVERFVSELASKGLIAFAE
jgi:hypothetical protein